MRRALCLLVEAYRWAVSPLLPRHCRFEPTCSQYALDALREERLPRALWLVIRRLGRCHPWGGSGWDPFPQLGAGASERSDSR